MRVRPDLLAGLASGVTAVGLLLATGTDADAAVLVGFAVAGLGIATMLPTVYDAAAQDRGRTGSALGALTAGIRASALTIPLVVGLVAASWSVGTAIAVVAFPSLAGFTMVATILARRRALPRG